MSAAVEPGPSGLGGGWRPLLLQLGAIVLVTAATLTWVALAPLTETERGTLAMATLLDITGEHLALTLTAAVITVVIAVPLGIALTRGPLRRWSPAVRAVANVGQAAPPLGLLVLLAVFLSFGFWPSVVALVVYAVLPVLTNTITGLDGVDPRLVEAGRGMGMSSVMVLLRVELPLAVPVMLAGIRTALVLLVGTAALATFVNGGGLGLLIVTGINLNLLTVLVVGGLLIALLALLVDWAGRVVEHVARPKGL